MKHYSRILLCLALVALLVFAGCVRPTPPVTNPDGETPEVIPLPTSGWMAYAPVQADTNPWQAYLPGLNGGKSELEQVKAWLEGNGIDATSYGFIPHDDVVCQSLNCARGDYLIIHPTDTKASTFLHKTGFFAFNEVGVFTSPSSGEFSYAVTIVNASSETIYYGGCNEFIPFLLTDEGAIPGPLKVCVWEGIPSGLQAGQSIDLPFMSQDDGTYSIEFGYSTGCIPGKPVSEAGCTGGKIIDSLPFEVNVFSSSEFVKMQYEITQCNTNPWQDMETTVTPAEDLANFTEWMNDHDVNPQSIQYVPPVEGQMVCLACSCGQGDFYRIVISANQQDEAEDIGFDYVGAYLPAQDTPAFEDAQWYVATPYQCYANKWNVEKKPIHSAGTDIAVMKEWLESKGVEVAFLTYLPGFNLTKECLKKSTDIYGVGVLDDDSAVLLQSLGFAVAGKTQVALFTSTADVEPLSLIYKSKFCTLPPWEAPVLSNGSEAEASAEAAEWLAEQGIELYSGPTVHTTIPSYSGTCDTESGLAMKISIPKWAKPHLMASGFTVPPYSFDAQNDQVYPAVSEETGN